MDVRSRSHTLKVCYRTSQQIRRAADRLLPTVLRDLDGIEDERRGIVLVFDGPPPEVIVAGSKADEKAAVYNAVAAWLSEDIAPAKIGIFVRHAPLLTRARAAIEGLPDSDMMTFAPIDWRREWSSAGSS